MAAADREDVATTGWGRQLLSHQSDDGTWGGGLYGPKWTLTAYTLLLLARLGLDPRNEQARRDVQLLWDGARYFDGGLTVGATIDFPGACVTSILALEALAGLPGVESTGGAVSQAVADGKEFFLRHRLYRSHRSGEIVRPAFSRLSFPPRWHYDVLRGLDYFAATNSAWDERLQDGLDLLVARQRKDGAWPVQN